MANIFKCAVCGRFVSYADLDSGKATHREITPDSAYTYEEWETLCPEHVDPPTTASGADGTGRSAT